MSAQLHLDNLSGLRGDCVKKWTNGKGRMDKNWHHVGKMVEKEEEQNGGTFSNSECGICWFVFWFRRRSQPFVPLSYGCLTLKPQLTVLIRLLCLKSTFSVFTYPILTNCTVVVAFHLHAVLNYLKCPNGTFFKTRWRLWWLVSHYAATNICHEFIWSSCNMIGFFFCFFFLKIHTSFKWKKWSTQLCEEKLA